MIFYHGTKDNKLKELVSNHSRDNYNYINSNRNYALVYATRKYINLFKNVGDKIYFYNIYPDLFNKLYFNDFGIIYSFEVDINDVEKVEKGRNCAFEDSYRTSKNIKLNDYEEVNVYDEFMKLRDQGIFIIVDDDEVVTKAREDYSNYFTDLYKQDKLSKEEIDYFDSYLPDLIKR